MKTSFIQLGLNFKLLVYQQKIKTIRLEQRFNVKTYK